MTPSPIKLKLEAEEAVQKFVCWPQNALTAAMVREATKIAAEHRRALAAAVHRSADADEVDGLVELSAAADLMLKATLDSAREVMKVTATLTRIRDRYREEYEAWLRADHDLDPCEHFPD